MRQFQMRRIVADGDMFDNFTRRAIDHRDAIVRRVGVNTTVGMASNGMCAAQTQTRRRAIGTEHQKTTFILTFK